LKHSNQLRFRVLESLMEGPAMLLELRQRIGEQSYQLPPIRNLRDCLNRLKEKRWVHFDNKVGLFSSSPITITEEGRNVVRQNRENAPADDGDRSGK
jgi:hypothetical protein